MPDFRMIAWLLLGTGILIVLVAGIGGLMDVTLFPDPPRWFAGIPLWNGFVNLLAMAWMLRGYRRIRQFRDVPGHRQAMMWALAFSLIFLVSYLTYHFSAMEIRFQTSYSWLRYLYLLILGTHIVTAAISAPLVLLAFYLGWTRKFTLHRKVVRWIFPIWLYTVATGIIVSVFLAPQVWKILTTP